MELLIKFDTVKSRWSIVYIEGSPLTISKIIIFISLQLKIDFILANSADSDAMQHLRHFDLGLHSLSKYPLWGFTTQRVKLCLI